MQEERETLIKQVFPGLRRFSRQRGVDLIEIDLRWGITEAQASRGEVLPVCIGEIDRCRPYFIGILGDRYGTVPEALPEAPWVLPGASMTHMEIEWAALRPGVDTRRAYFFFKRNAPGPESQRSLKAEIRGAGLPVEEYDHADDLGPRIERVLKAAIDEDFPEARAPTWLDIEREAIEVFQATRVAGYVARAEWLKRLDGPESVVVTGRSGQRQICVAGELGRPHLGASVRTLPGGHAPRRGGGSGRAPAARRAERRSPERPRRPPCGGVSGAGGGGTADPRSRRRRAPR